MSNSEINSIAILGAGWLGKPLGKRLVKLGYEVNGSTTSPEKLASIQEDGMIPYIIKVSDHIQGDNWQDFFQADLLILNLPPRRRIPDIEQRYPAQMHAIAKALSSSPIRYCIFVSSTSVYGNHNKVVTEQSPLEPTTGSGRALVKSEAIFQEMTALQTTVLRMAGLAGDDRKVGRFLAGKKNLSNANAKVNLVHLEDCIGIIETVIKQEAWNEVFNVCADEHPVKKDFYVAQAKAMGLEPPTFSLEETQAYKIVSNEKLKRILGYVFKKPDPYLF